jgi:PAS domain S-box-containing protein
VPFPHHAREALVTKLTNTAHDIVIVTDGNGLTIWVNDAFEKLTGYGLHEIAGRKPGLVLQGRETDQSTVREISEAIEARQPIKTQILNYTKSGSPIWLDVEISAMFDEAGRLNGFISIERDISDSVKLECDLSHAALERMKAEGRLSAAIDAIPDPFAIYDENDRLVMEAKCNGRHDRYWPRRPRGMDRAAP